MSGEERDQADEVRAETQRPGVTFPRLEQRAQGADDAALTVVEQDDGHQAAGQARVVGQLVLPWTISMSYL